MWSVASSGVTFVPSIRCSRLFPASLYLRRRAGTRADDRLSQLVELALAESRERQSGTRCVLLHLSELLFVEVVRRYLDSFTSEQTGWLAGLRDPIAGHALALLHNRPADAWSLGRLAREIGVSRSSLADASARSSANRRCAISRSGGSSSLAGCSPTTRRRCPRSHSMSAITRKRPSAAPSRRWWAPRQRPGDGADVNWVSASVAAGLRPAGGVMPASSHARSPRPSAPTRWFRSRAAGARTG